MSGGRTESAHALWKIYRRLHVREVWFWERDAIQVFLLEGKQYVAAPESECLPGIDLALVCRLVRVQPTSAAIKELRAILESAPSHARKA